jgi:hypothetical protein
LSVSVVLACRSITHKQRKRVAEKLARHIDLFDCVLEVQNCQRSRRVGRFQLFTRFRQPQSAHV